MAKVVTKFNFNDYNSSRLTGFTSFNFKTVEKKILLGFEFEVETPNGETSRETDEVLNTFSLHHPYAVINYEWFGGNSHGPEYKSFVAPLEIHKKFLQDKLNHFQNKRRAEEQSHGGIHISVNINDFTYKYREKVFEFLHNTQHRQLFLKLSGRTENHFEHYCPQNNEAGTDYHYNIINEENVSYHPRTNEPSGRFEFRLFHAQKKLLFPAMEMIESLFQLAHKLNEDQPITRQNWFKFISSRRKYDNIYKRAKEVGYTMPEKTSTRKVRTI